MTTTIRRFRGCFLGGPVHGHELPPEIRAPRLVYREQTEAGLVEHVYAHRRLDTPGEDGVVASVTFLVLESLDEEAAHALAAEECERRGGWGEGLALPAAGFRYETEAAWDRDLAAGTEGLGAFGLVKRFGPTGMAIAASLYDTSRAVALEEIDQARCEWCAAEIGHTIEIHRQRLEQDAAERRAEEVRARRPIPEPHPLALAVIRGLETDEDALYCAQASEALVLEEARARFIARRRAEAAANEPEAPRIVLPAGVRA